GGQPLVPRHAPVPPDRAGPVARCLREDGARGGEDARSGWCDRPMRENGDVRCLGLPDIDGYKPASNFQALLAREVEAFLDKTPAVLQQLATAPLVNPTKVPKSDGLTLDQITEKPPEQLLLPTLPSSPWLSRKAKRIDFAEREAANRLLGK